MAVQMVETTEAQRKARAERIAAIFGVEPHKITNEWTLQSDDGGDPILRVELFAFVSLAEANAIINGVQLDTP